MSLSGAVTLGKAKVGEAEGGPADDCEGVACPDGERGDVAGATTGRRRSASDWSSASRTTHWGSLLAMTRASPSTSRTPALKSRSTPQAVFGAVSTIHVLARDGGPGFSISASTIFRYRFSLSFTPDPPLRPNPWGVSLYNGDTESSLGSFEAEIQSLGDSRAPDRRTRVQGNSLRGRWPPIG